MEVKSNEKINELLPNGKTILSIVSSLQNDSISTTDSERPRTELDSHANMAVLGKHCFVFERTGRHCDVSAFSPTIETTSLPIVDAVIVYDCPFRLQSYLLMVRNAIYVAEMEHNLIPPFLLREANIQVNDCAKIHATKATEQHHSILFTADNLRIPLRLQGTFSYFHHRLPLLEEIDTLQVLFLTPDSASWDPHSVHYSLDEDSHLDHNGNIVERPTKIL